MCKTYHTNIKHVGNTTYFTNHVDRWHPELASTTATQKVDTSQPRIDQSLVSSLPHMTGGMFHSEGSTLFCGQTGQTIYFLTLKRIVDDGGVELRRKKLFAQIW